MSRTAESDSRRPPAAWPIALTIAGSDSGGGAGIQADLKTFAAHGVYGTSVVTAVTAQNTRAVTAVHQVPPAAVAAQIDAVFDDFEIAAVKIGMLGAASTVRAVAAGLSRWTGPPVVLDPVMVAKSGDPLLADDAVAALADELLPLATLVTPNLPELERLTGRPAGEEPARRAAAEALAGTGVSVLAKGGHGSGEEIVDLLVAGGGSRRFGHRRRATSSTHGTGCTLSSAIAARLARGADLTDAVEGAIDYLVAAIDAAYPIGRGHGPVQHFWRGRAA